MVTLQLNVFLNIKDIFQISIWSSRSATIATKQREVQRKGTFIGLDLEVDLRFVRERYEIQHNFKNKS